MTKIKMAETTCETPPMMQGMKFASDKKHQIAEIPTPTAPASAKILFTYKHYIRWFLQIHSSQKRNHAVEKLNFKLFVNHNLPSVSNY